ncbi:MAG: MotA/TolQ/ExbB proton channel family protein [Stenotrophomonas nitritireducens]|uniref:MotA/TolQ/ExbB proton channel family protein n=1 Tax=Stenotrophomonas nitritireducens TaxID=83617 RepID=A0A9D8PV35_9GAMM|nr:MotA/TolQ/ExbB proton channel family protein [Stenotrophomonas nitritireducens]MBN8790648.1 MotA/TolQ/ExbB proton channel family protein [Stenotrophomonas nitritireducens]MBN8797597.1 MotA/TolQ/ExbB proton channel family protein [Stenotrophomonas nitritireducens]MBN8798058.1 MotA/TolQ/ExbB proton channel family protein [Stenotrophomonas nitritireducens]
MWELVKAGGWPMVPLLLLGVLALAIVLERFWSLRRNEVLPPGLGQEVRNWAARGKLDASHIESLRANSPLGALLAAALEARNRPRDQIRERIEDTGRHLVHRMGRYLNALGTIASAGPLLGLLGTVIGMIQMFLGILDHGVGDVNQLAGGIGKALVCTATGMIVAIPALMFHRYFRARVDGYVIEMEHEAGALLDTLDGRPAVMAATRPAPQAVAKA